MDNWTSNHWKTFFSIYEKILRQGPGDNNSTVRALKTFMDLPQDTRILEVGCGTGVQSIELAKNLGLESEVWATEMHSPFIDILNNKIKKENITNLKALTMDMCNIEAPKNYFDLIWAEGSIYFYGFENALKDWKEYFRGKARFAFTEPNWFKKDIPDKAKEVWQGYEICSIEETSKRIKELGYNLLDCFKLPSTAWSQNYYEPLQKELDKNSNNFLDSEAKEVIDSIKKEINDYKLYGEYYGYTFYICEG
jgi:cyclopropane fatty-acyl-phospholipid synthase-like methyltransferase